MLKSELSFYIDGIRCQGCVSQIDRALAPFSSPLAPSQIDRATNTFSLNPSLQKSLPQINHQLEKLGFKMRPANEAAIKILAHQARKKLLKQIGVAGACAGNMMLFTIPIYAGLEGDLQFAFLWITFLLNLPVLFYSATPFYNGALASVKTRTINIDLLISIAFLSTTALSIYHLLNKNSDVYFDSTASFLFLILTTRYFMDDSRERLLKPIFLNDFIPNEKYKKENGESISPNKILTNDNLIIGRGQLLPIDAINKTENAAFDSSFIDGESVPKMYPLNSDLPAGLRAFEDQILVQAKGTLKESRLSKFISDLNKTYLNSSAALKEADVWAQALMTAVLSLAAVVFVSGYWFGFEEMLRRSTALLVMACPCALAFAAPATVGAFIKKALKKNIFIKNAQVFSKISKIKNIFLDKTGTLTYDRLHLVGQSPSVVPLQIQQIILGLESQSHHPVAFALREAWPHVSAAPLNDNHETTGYGVSGRLNGDEYALRSLGETTHSDDYAVGLYKNNELLIELYFSNQIKPEAFHFIRALKKLNFDVFILSGDQRSRVEKVADCLEVDKSKVFSEAFPEEKAEVISQYQPALMVGDGINDSLALQKADIGISVRGAIDSQINSAPVAITNTDLFAILDFIKMAQDCNSTLQRNFILALVYNSIGGFLAISGYADPLVAAVAMPISSTLILFSTWYGVSK